MANEQDKTYIGDGVYVEFDGYQLIVTTENGISVTNLIVIEPQIWSSLQHYVKSLEEKHNFKFG